MQRAAVAADVDVGGGSSGDAHELIEVLSETSCCNSGGSPSTPI